ncbi:MAG: hypothetical protein M3539_09260 [Acidobacteriota bacterium]|nr:hypothetical protein [Acidobacteriota bacterium]
MTKGLVVHGMQGFDFERAKTDLHIPEGFRVEAMIGKPGNIDVLPPELRDRELPSDRRKLEETICEGRFVSRQARAVASLQKVWP